MPFFSPFTRHARLEWGSTCTSDYSSFCGKKLGLSIDTRMRAGLLPSSFHFILHPCMNAASASLQLTSSVCGLSSALSAPVGLPRDQSAFPALAKRRAVDDPSLRVCAIVMLARRPFAHISIPLMYLTRGKLTESPDGIGIKARLP